MGMKINDMISNTERQDTELNYFSMGKRRIDTCGGSDITKSQTDRMHEKSQSAIPGNTGEVQLSMKFSLSIINADDMW